MKKLKIMLKTSKTVGVGMKFTQLSKVFMFTFATIITTGGLWQHVRCMEENINTSASSVNKPARREELNVHINEAFEAFLIDGNEEKLIKRLKVIRATHAKNKKGYFYAIISWQLIDANSETIDPNIKTNETKKLLWEKLLAKEAFFEAINFKEIYSCEETHFLFQKFVEQNYGAVQYLINQP